MDGSEGARGPFETPLFQDPEAQALRRVGVVDVGSNSIRMVVFDGAARSPAYFYNEKVMAGLGAGLPETGRLNPEGRKRALAALRRFQLLSEGMGVAPLTVVATAAVREAEDGPDFIEEVERETGLKLFVIDGDEEARLSAQGVLLGWPEASGVVCDIGGSSMELARIDSGRVGERVTSPLGPLRLQGIEGGRKGRRAHIRKIVDDLVTRIGARPKHLYLVGGSWRAIARLDMERRGYPLQVLHEYEMSRKDVAATIDWIEDARVEDLRAATGIGEARMALVPLASEVLGEVVRRLKPATIFVSSYGIREGLLYEQMPDALRARDPLIEAARFAEHKDARQPGFGRSLFKFIFPLFRAMRPDRKRIIRAACLLHDVSWRAHPDYRHEACFDNVTRANLGGLTHEERVFLGLALLHRYKNSRSESRLLPMLGLLTDEAIRDAEILGKAMRFGAMIYADAPEEMGTLDWFPKKKVLRLNLTRRAEGLFGEVAEARLKSLASALNAQTEVRRLR
ncbi:Ppx/GppA family phosphatase [Anianabacter salinae]|uniref:Ppx/GppA family phosphatase n=1 Tax=Anianabacter salinae TaxID=2851023 RepID=UPI00225DF34B|nr:Ppx/GppA family phosphatase [Anianabacter salinae]MBV0913918.1 Ppx/GppA family phosphatase [Anianabacter salinae]